MSIVPANMNELQQIQAGIVGTVSDNVSIESRFTPRLQLLAALSKIRTQWNKDQGPKPEEGNFALGPPGFIFLSNQFFCVPLAWRDHALRTKGDDVLLESYNSPALGCLPKTPEEQVFNDIKMAAAAKSEADKKANIQNRTGKDVLVWVPQQAIQNSPYPQMSKGVYGAYFLAGTATPEAENFKVNFFKKVRVRSRQIDNRKTGFTWFVPEVELQDGGILEQEEMPNMVITKEEMTKFANPTAKGSDLPQATAAPGVDGRAR